MAARVCPRMPASEIALMLALLHGRYVLVTGQLGWSRNVTQCHGQGMALGTKLRQSQGRPRRQGKVYEEGGVEKFANRLLSRPRPNCFFTPA